MSKSIYDVLVAETYEYQGETRSKFHNVGTAWPLDEKDGFSVQVHPNISIGGRLVILPRRDRKGADGEA